MSQNHTWSEGRNQRLLASRIAATGAFALNQVFLKGSVWMAPDSWALWEGSASLLEGRGYRLFWGDAPIKEWPPLYSLYLAFWQYWGGISGRALILAQSTLAGLATFGWCLLALSLVARSRLPRKHGWICAVSCSAFITVFVATRYDAIRANNLQYAFLPAFISLCEGLRRPCPARTAAAGLLGALLLLTHVSSIAFVLAAVTLLVFEPDLVPMARAIHGFFLASISLLPYACVRRILGQTGSHRIGLHAGVYSPAEYLVQEIGGSCTLLIRQRAPAVLVASALLAISIAVSRSRPLDAPASRVARWRITFVLIAMGALFVLFNIVYIVDNLSGRFLFFVPLALVPVALVAAARARRPWAVLAASTLCLIAQAPRISELGVGLRLSADGRTARPEQMLRAEDCVQRPDGAPTWPCSPGSQARVAPPPPPSIPGAGRIP
jgi:hypothetical protein